MHIEKKKKKKKTFIAIHVRFAILQMHTYKKWETNTNISWLMKMVGSAIGNQNSTYKRPTLCNITDTQNWTFVNGWLHTWNQTLQGSPIKLTVAAYINQCLAVRLSDFPKGIKVLLLSSPVVLASFSDSKQLSGLGFAFEWSSLEDTTRSKNLCIIS